MMKDEHEITNLDVDFILSGAVDGTQKVGVAFDDDNNPTVGFVIVGKDSNQYREKLKEVRASGIRRQANKRTKIDIRTPDGAEQFDEILQSNEFELACAVVVDWFGFTKDGKNFPFDARLVRQMLQKKSSWREKITQALEADEAFLKLSSANSLHLRVVNSDLTEEDQTE